MLVDVQEEALVMAKAVFQVDSCGEQAEQVKVRAESSLQFQDIPAKHSVYAYIPTSSSLCDQSNVMCNSDDYGTSLARGSFSYQTGRWQTIWLLVMLNEVGTRNGVVQYVS